MTTLDDMLGAYVECALWSSTVDRDDCEQPGSETVPMDAHYGPDDIAPEALESMRQDCDAFLSAAAELGHGLDSLSIEQVGHDFWLTRNHHGAGFWDRGLGEVGEQLSELARPFGESDLYVGDDGRLYV